MKKIKSINEWNNVLGEKNVLAVFSADWCPDCRVIEPVLPEIEAAFPEFEFVLVDRDQLIEVCQQYDVFGIPSFIAFKDGKESGRFVSKNRKSKEEIIAFMEEIKD